MQSMATLIVSPENIGLLLNVQEPSKFHNLKN